MQKTNRDSLRSVGQSFKPLPNRFFLFPIVLIIGFVLIWWGGSIFHSSFMGGNEMVRHEKIIKKLFRERLISLQALHEQIPDFKINLEELKSMQLQTMELDLTHGADQKEFMRIQGEISNQLAQMIILADRQLVGQASYQQLFNDLLHLEDKINKAWDQFQDGYFQSMRSSR